MGGLFQAALASRAMAGLPVHMKPANRTRTKGLPRLAPGRVFVATTITEQVLSVFEGNYPNLNPPAP
jgi:hypothetical protein